ncbi:MAG: glycoside hydrolase family 20 zincin-like fold domain-containing protein [Planctomycetaceae bacterium]|nr:glycoside hydrolase family 20 zincin-like fold domain-containing protein [Planctomycetaceae bacterium]
MSNSVRIVCNTARTPVVERAISIFERTLAERCGMKLSDRAAACTITLATMSGLAAEGFNIAGDAAAITISGADERGLLYGAGKFLRDAQYGPQSFRPGAWRGTSVPAKPVRGMYFASHFHNFYHDAPVEKIQRYVEELALWGCNALAVWFDMHHFSGIDDAAAREMIARLRAVIEAANCVGMAPALTTLANEAYANSPEHLRADWTAGHDGYTSPPGGHYHVEICPSKPGGLEQILKDRREMLDAFADLGIKYIWIWPYDQGGCTCKDCAPWGANGFLRNAKAYAELAAKVCPGAKIILSTWYFDHFTSGEWQGLADAFAAEKPDWTDYILADDCGSFPAWPLEHGVPGGLPAVSFAEISMQGMYPWGAFGANPRPTYWQQHWNKSRNLLSGGFPYSEGIYEDINKVIQFQFGWNPDRPAADIVREYAAWEFAPEAADDAANLVTMLEQSLGSSAGGNFPDDLYRDDAAIYHQAKPELADAAWALAQQIDRRLPAYARKAWRWRIVYLRAALEEAIKASGGRSSPHIETLLDELIDIFHAVHAEQHVIPPAREALRRIYREGLKQT